MDTNMTYRSQLLRDWGRKKKKFRERVQKKKKMDFSIKYRPKAKMMTYASWNLGDGSSRIFFASASSSK